MADTPDDHESQYGDVEYADPKNHKYPIDTQEHVRAAWSYINMPKNQDGYTAEEVAAIKAKIKAAGKKYGIQFEDTADTGSRALNDDSTIERRTVVMPVELRALPDGAEGRSRTIGGYAAVFNSESRVIPRGHAGGFVEVVTPGFFQEARAAGWPGNQGSGVLCRYNHNDQYLLGTTAAGTCELNLNRTGLEYRTQVPNCREDVLELVDRGDIRQSSFTFMDAEDEWSYSGGIAMRALLTGAVLDVAPVSAVPAYRDTTVGMRSLAASKDVPVSDVYALAQRDELRQLFVRTDQALSPATPTTEERTVATEDQEAGAEAPEAAAPAAAPQSPAALEDEPAATLSWQEVQRQVMEKRYPSSLPT